jgi:DNA-directed RNA polymerase specialized sigma24 family protein
MDKQEEALILLKDMKGLEALLNDYSMEHGDEEYALLVSQAKDDLLQRKKCAINCLKKMSVENQRLIILRYFQNNTKEEIGVKVGYTYRTVWDKIHAAEKEFIEKYEQNFT